MTHIQLLKNKIISEAL